MARRRSDTPVTPQALLDQATHHALDWPGTTVRLERDSVQDFVQRSMSRHVSLGELCHENSKLWPARLRELACSRIDASAFKADVVRRRAAARRHGVPPLEGDRRTRALLATLATLVPPELFYAVELRLVIDDVVAVLEPLAGTCHIATILTTADQQALTGALQLLPSAPGAPFDGVLAFVVGSFARNELLYGHRGHRRTLLEAGQLVQAVTEAAATGGLLAQAHYEFADREVDSVIEADGIEVAVLAVVSLAEQAR